MSNSAPSTLVEEYLASKRALFDKYYSFLNEKQREAVYTAEGPLLVLAGAGTGKTTVLVNRIGFIVRYGNAYFDNTVPNDISSDDISDIESAKDLEGEALGEYLERFKKDPCPPYAMLAITFTNKAANEIKERLALNLGEDTAKEICAGTFHSVCVRFLRQFGEKIGYRRSFTIYDTDDSKKIIAECQKDLNIDDKEMPVKKIMSIISQAKERLQTPEEFAKDSEGDFRMHKIAVIYELYQKKLFDANALDFDDIIVKTVELLQKFPEVREYFHRRFKYVCVDEYQDTNPAQFELTRLLVGGGENIMVVGDDDQSIYKFRGATIENILHFDDTYPALSIIKLEQNYRSTKNILEAANSVIRNNFGRRGKELWSLSDEGEKIWLRKTDNQNEEARFIINKIMDMVIREKRKYSDFAILYRTNAQSNAIESIFAKSGVPYRMLGGLRFYDRKEVKDIISYLCVINNHNDNLRLKRIINEPKRKIGDTTVSALDELSTYENKSIFDIIMHVGDYPVLAKSAAKLSEFGALITKLTDISKEASLDVLFKETIERSGYMQMLIDAGSAESSKIDNVNELISSAVEYEKNNPDGGLSGFLEEVSLISDIDNYSEDANAVTMMTIHSAKGLEFPVVFVPGMEEGLFPNMQSAMMPDELEEERRLAYVAITRARQRLFLTFTRERLLYGRTQFNSPSRFIAEIPEKFVFDDSPKIKPRITEDAVNIPRRKNTSSMQNFLKQSDISSGIGHTTSYERFECGDRVHHMVFGDGTILSAKEMGADIIYEIAFENVGTKKLMATFAKLTKAK
ncbi:MAG: UvrD-helicase domain-containing protein [Clostridia bacterium]|nr:UvrD-helicase domain-containing protein [Clostridia bacterium]